MGAPTGGMLMGMGCVYVCGRGDEAGTRTQIRPKGPYWLRSATVYGSYLEKLKIGSNLDFYCKIIEFGTT